MRTLRLILPGICGAAFGSLMTAIAVGPIEGLRVFALTVALLWCIVELIERVMGRRKAVRDALIYGIGIMQGSKRIDPREFYKPLSTGGDSKEKT